MKKAIYILLAALTLGACSETAEERREREAAERRQMEIEDSLAFKVAVMPTIDCLPFFIIEEHALIPPTEIDLNFKHYTAQMDCDTALERGRAELAVSDVVRVERMKKRGVAVDYLTQTNAEWFLLGNNSRDIAALRGLQNKMIAMTRYSATDMLSTMAMDSARLSEDRTFRVQINDVFVRWQMLRNNEMDALWLAEPFATAAREDSNTVMMSSQEKGLRLGVVAMRSDIEGDSVRRKQLEEIVRVYNAVCDSINNKGVKHYKNIIVKYCKVAPETVSKLPEDIHFTLITPPRREDIEAAKKWLEDNDNTPNPNSAMNNEPF